MKAVVCYGNNDIRYEEVEEPQSREGQVKIKVRTCGICGSDIPRATVQAAHHYPIILGHEFSGEVAEIGENVNEIKVGDRVTAAPLIPCFECEQCEQGNYSLCENYSFIGSRQSGAMAEYVVVPAKNICKLPDKISFEHGAFFEPATVALHAFYLNDYAPGGYVAIMGGGTIGVFALQWAKILGCKKVVVFGRDKKHLELSLKLGADKVISTLDKDFKEQAMKFTKGRGFDYIFETAGSSDTIKYSLELGAKKSKICFVGTPKTDITFSPKEWEQINRKECRLTGSWMSYSAPFPGKEWEMTSKHFANGDLKFDEDMIFRKFKFEDAQETFNLFKDENIKIKGRMLFIN